MTNFSCHTRFVSLSDHDWKASTCLRAYKKYKGLYDASLVLASVDSKDKGLVVRASAAGVSRENGLGFIKKFMESVSWRP